MNFSLPAQAEIEESLKFLMSQPGVLGYVVINGDGKTARTVVRRQNALSRALSLFPLST